MGLHRTGSLLAIVEQRQTILVDHLLLQPVDKLAGPLWHRRAFRSKRPQVVGDGARGEDANPLTAQRPQYLSQLPQLGRGKARGNGDLHQRDLAVWVDQGERRPDPVIQLAPHRGGGQSGQCQPVAHPLLQPLGAAGRPAHPVEGLGKAVKVVHQGRFGLDVDLQLAAEPVGGDDHQPLELIQTQGSQKAGGGLLTQHQIRCAVRDKPDGGEGHKADSNKVSGGDTGGDIAVGIDYPPAIKGEQSSKIDKNYQLMVDNFTLSRPVSSNRYQGCGASGCSRAARSAIRVAAL